MSWFWPRGASGSQRDGVVQLVCSSVVRRTRGQPTGGAGIACERCADLQESLLVSYWTLASSRCADVLDRVHGIVVRRNANGLCMGVAVDGRGDDVLDKFSLNQLKWREDDRAMDV